MSEKLQTDSQISHYRIISKLGAGGMGEVWLAEDTRLDRKVALKLLPAEFTQDSERVRRFTQEAKAASALNHPNIITVYDIGECDTGRYIVMELVSGSTLRSVIANDNSVETFFNLGGQMARALSAAHSAGITHRDIKPDNIMIRNDGYVKMLDFGLARLLPTSSSDPEAMTLAQQTTPGTVMGTLAYMSPEQASGLTASSPSDVFALGIVLYELVTGQHPFKSETMLGYLHAITNQSPLSLTSHKSDLPVALDQLILRMLEKNPNDRPTAGEVVQSLFEIEKYGSNKTLPIQVVTRKPAKSKEDEQFWIAVLPFKYRGSSSELEALAEGLSEEITTGLSRFSYLRVISLSSTQRYANETADIRTVGSELSARYVMEGSLRLAGSHLRVTVQLVDSKTGAHLWVESYNRSYNPESIFDLQDDLAPRVVATVADMNGVLLHTMGELLRQRDPNELTPSEAVLRGLAYISRSNAEEHLKVRDALERAVVEAPDQSDCWSVLSMAYCDEYHQDFNVQPNSLDRALTAAQRATACGPANHLAHFSLASVLFFRRDFQSFSIAAERAIALNPMDATTTSFLGSLIAYSGDWDRGCELAEKGMDLNPNQPGWFRFTAYFKEYAKRNYRAALDVALKMNMPGYYFINAALAAAYGQLGELDNARVAVRELLKEVPNFAQAAREDYEKWFGPGELVEDVLDGLRKAGLDIPEAGLSSVTSTPSAPSNEIRIDEGFWVAVLPFRVTGSNAELAMFAEGLSDEIITGLNRFSYLRVIARSSTLRYASQTTDVRAVGVQLGARYVMEGTLRQAGSKIRLTVQLADTTTGAHLWAENYERTFSSESIFELQDDLVPRIVSTVADSHGVLPRSMSETVQNRTLDELSPYEAVLRSFKYSQHVTRDAMLDAIQCLELAVQKAPKYADAWAVLGAMLVQDYAQGYNVREDSLALAEAASRKAVDLAPSSHWSWASLARVHFFQKEPQRFRNEVEKAVALNPMDGDSHASLGEMLAFSGDVDRGLELVERAKQLNPNYPGWYWYVNFFQAYKQKDYKAALNFATKVNLPGHWAQPLFTAAARGQLGETEVAAKAVGDLLRIRPDVASVRTDLNKWFSADDVEHLLDGARKAGLVIDDGETGRVGDWETGRRGDGETGRRGDAETGRRGDAETGRRGDGESVSPSSAHQVTPSSRLPFSPSPTHPVSPSAFSSSGSLIKSIAVLPFHNLSGDPEQEFFADGITEEILNALAQIDGLRVAGRSSSFSFKGRNEDLRSIGSQLNVGTILEGTLRRSGDRLRITTQLIDASNGYQIWSERYDKVIDDIFNVQDEIASTIAGRLQVSFSEEYAVDQRPTKNIEAYQLYLKGRAFLYQRGLSIPKAIECFKQAVGLDPSYAQAWAGLADGYTTSGYSGYQRPENVMPLAMEAAKRALELDADLAESHNALACATMLWEKNFELAEVEFRRALELNPNYSQARAWFGLFFLQWICGREEEVREEMRKLVQIDPLSAYTHVIFCFAAVCSGRFTEGLAHGTRGAELDPNSYLAQWCCGLSLEYVGRYEEAAIALEKALAMSARHPWALMQLVSNYAASGKIEEARTILSELEARSTREYIQPGMLVAAASSVGEMDRAIEYAQYAVDIRDPMFLMLARTWPDYKNVRDDARFRAIVSQLNLPGWTQ